MKAIILAAGRSSRFYPFSNGMHKAMISLLGKPILAHTIEGLKKAGITKIVLIVGNDGAISKYFGNGKRFGVDIDYVVQKEPLGMGDALLKARKHIKGEFLLLGANHVNSEILIKEIMVKKSTQADGIVMVKKRVNTWDYGVVDLKEDRVLNIVEKPKKESELSNCCLVSIYYLPLSFISFLKKASKHHYNFEEALNNFAKIHKVKAVITEQDITTLKYPWDLLGLKNYLLKKVKKFKGENVVIAKSAEILGEVAIESNAVVMEGVRIKGPCYIGRNVVIGNNTLLRNGVSVEENTTIGAYSEVKNSLVMSGTKIHSGFIGDSVIGRNCKIGAQFCTANVRLDRETVKAIVQNKKIDTGRKHVGVLMGDNVHVGIKSSTMPGVIIGNNAIIGPSTTVFENVNDNTKYYSKFQKIITQK